MPKKKRREDRPPPEWDFFSFPTFVGLAGGLTLGFVLLLMGPFFIQVLFVLVLFTVSFSFAHLVTHRFVARRRRVQADRAEEEERERRALAARRAAEPPPAEQRKRRRRRGGGR